MVTSDTVVAEPVRPQTGGRFTVAIFGLLLVALTWFAYANSLRAPMEFDDHASLVENASIRKLWPLSGPLSPPGWGRTVQGRPLLNLSFAIDYAVGGLDVRGYHLGNVAIHILAGLWLFGLIGLTLRSPALGVRFGGQADSLAAIGAGLWLLHPLQIESVTYIVQRAESMAGLFLFLSLYGFARAIEGKFIHRSWAMISIAAAFCGVATKESVVVLPLLALLYDRAFFAGSFRSAWLRRWTLYLALAATWVPLAWFVLRAGSRGGTFSLADPAAWWRYALTQPEAILRYLCLVVWPAPLVFDYGTFWRSFAEVWLPAVAVLGLAVTAGYVVLRRRVYGFLVAWFVLTLAPSTVLPGTIQMIVEHRMYLPLAAFAAAAVHGVSLLSVRFRMAAAVGILGAFAVLTGARNRTYGSEVALWTDTVAKRPGNGRAYANLGAALLVRGNVGSAESMLRRSIQLDPGNPEARFNWGLALERLNRPADAAEEFGAAARLKPQLATASFKEAEALLGIGRHPEAIAALQRAIAADPGYTDAYYQLALELAAAGDREAARGAYAQVLRLDPDHGEARLNLGIIEAESGENAAALADLAIAVRLRPRSPEAHQNFAVALTDAGRLTQAETEFRVALGLRPNYAQAHYNYGNALIALHRLGEARVQFERALACDPNLAPAREMLERVSAAQIPPQSNR